MQNYSLWRKHANDPDWYSRYIDVDRTAALGDFTSTINGSGTATIGPTGLVIVNSAGANDTMQFQYSNNPIQAKAPKAPTANDPRIFQYEMEFIIQGIFGSPASLVASAGFYAPDTTIITGHSDSIALVTPANTGAMALDFFIGSVNQNPSYPAGALNPNGFGFLPTDGLSHELAFQVIPWAGAGNAGEIKVSIDGNWVADFGLADQLYWVNLTQAFLAPAFAIGNSNGNLTVAQRTVTLQRIGWAVRF